MGSLTWASTSADSANSATLDQTVDLTNSDAFAALQNRFSRLDLIKADIEGWEMRALKGGQRTLTRFHPTLYLEIDDALLARAGDSPEALFDWLGALGYRGFSTPDLRPAPRWAGPGDYLFTAANCPDLARAATL